MKRPGNSPIAFLAAFLLVWTVGMSDILRANPLLRPWTGPMGGVPPMDQVEVAHFEPAFEQTMALYRADIDRIATRTEPPTVANTLEALEAAGRDFNRVQTVYQVWGSTLSSPEFQAVERRMEPLLAALRDEISQNEPLFRRITALHESPDSGTWTPEQRRLAWHYHTQFVKAGARLDAAGKTRVASINQSLAEAYTRFNQNLLADEEQDATVLDSLDDLDGMPQPFIDAARALAGKRGLQERWMIANTRSSVEPFLSLAHRRSVREQVWRRFVSRGDHPGERDNKPVLTRILQLRAERARLLGFPTHAHWRLENSMAGTPDRAAELMETVWKPAVARVREEVADMQALADAEGHGIRIEPWDYRYYAEKVRRARYEIDDAAIKPYLQLDRLVEGMFWIAGELFQLRFTPEPSVPVAHPDIRVWSVHRADGSPVGLFYFDPFARPGKRSGAWMSTYRRQEAMGEPVRTIVSNNCNFMAPTPGQPALLSWDDATTLLHEFGHGLHGLSSDVRHPSLSGTSVARDYVELPSQLLERWLGTPEFLSRFARHHQTGEPMPEESVARIRRAATFNQGFGTTEFLASGLLDMELHRMTEPPSDPARFEKEALSRLGMPSEIVMRHRLPQFAHLFSSDGYSAGYYSYLWADVLTADAAEAFQEAGGFYDVEVARRFNEFILSRGNTLDPVEGYRAFRGRDARIDALMRDRGFPVPPTTR